MLVLLRFSQILLLLQLLQHSQTFCLVYIVLYCFSSLAVRAYNRATLRFPRGMSSHTKMGNQTGQDLARCTLGLLCWACGSIEGSKHNGDMLSAIACSANFASSITNRLSLELPFKRSWASRLFRGFSNPPTLRNGTMLSWNWLTISVVHMMAVCITTWIWAGWWNTSLILRTVFLSYAHWIYQTKWSCKILAGPWLRIALHS